MRRSRTTALDPTEVVCHFCREPRNGTSPYRTWADDSYPTGTRFLVCGPQCPDAPTDAPIFAVEH